MGGSAKPGPAWPSKASDDCAALKASIVNHRSSASLIARHTAGVVSSACSVKLTAAVFCERHAAGTANFRCGGAARIPGVTDGDDDDKQIWREASKRITILIEGIVGINILSRSCVVLEAD